jgi:protein-disulfide isomerase
MDKAQPPFNLNIVWSLVTGLAVGYVVGNLAPMRGGNVKGGAAIAAVPGDDRIPADWVNEAEMGMTDAFAGLTPDQRYLALKVLNTKPCDCGCPHGNIARCKKEDPSCPVAPTEIQIATREAKAGKTYDEIFAAVQKPSVVAGAGSAAAPVPQGPHRVPLSPGIPIHGAKNAKVTIVMFSDFQCPFCGRVEPTLKQVMDDYKNDVRLAWHNYPLPFHSHAMEAAEAAMAADAQGKFWQMHDKLFANQGTLDRASLDKFASEIGLDMAKYKAAMDAETYKDKIQEEITYGNSVGVNGTPAFFINGQFLNGAVGYMQFKQKIDAEIDKATALLKAGTPQDKLYDAELAAVQEGPAAAQ